MDVSRIVRTSITTGELDPPPDLVQGVNTGAVPLLDIVRALGEYLTTTEDDVRLNGLTFLTNTTKVIAPNRINRQATQTLARFYLSKLDEFDSLPLALQALTVLSKLPVFDDDAAVEVYKSIVENVNMKSYVQATRHMVYTVFDSLLALHRQALKNMGSEFLNSYTKMLDGEKDPRNLMLLFSMDRVILLEFDVKDIIEDMFDITFCYFPISFKPPPNDPYGITADDLKLALRSCMSASPYFAKMALPLFLEKFATSTGPAMKDLMLSMAACFPIYGAEAVSERGTELWEGIKTEIMYSSDTAIEAAALSALESLLRSLYPNTSDTPSGLAQDVIKQCLEVLQEPEKTQGISATKALAAVIRASPSTGAFALSQALPQLFRQFNRPSLPSHRSPILGSISSLLIACRSIYAAPDSIRREVDEKSLQPYRESILDVLREGLRTDSLKEPAVRGSVALIEIPGFLTREEVEDLVRGLNEILTHDNDAELRAAAVDGISAICKLHSSIIEITTLPLLFHNLPDIPPPAHAINDRQKYRSVLSSLSKLCVQPSLFETLVIRITTKLDLLSSQPSHRSGDGDVEMDGNGDEARECLVSYAWDLLSCLYNVINAKLASKHVDVVKYFDIIIPKLYELVISASAPVVGDSQPLFRDRRLLGIVGKISEKLMWELNVERQAKQFAAVYAAFERGEVSGIVRDASRVKGVPGSPLRNGASSYEQDLVSLYSSTTQGLKAGVCLVEIPYRSVADYLSSKIHWTIHIANDEYHVRWALDMITAIVNKRSDELRDSLDGILEVIWVREVIDTDQPFEIRRRGILVYLHVIKALALLRLPLAYAAVDRVVAILKLVNFDPDFVKEAARGFAILGKGKEKESHLTAKLLYAQKLWNHILPRLIEGDVEATGKDRLVYLVAFSSLLPLVPASLCLSELPTILPLLLRSLSLQDPSQRVNVIKTLISIIETANMSTPVDQLLHQQAPAIVDSLLKNALNDPSTGLESSGVARSTALRCLAIIPDVIRHDSLHTVKAGVLKELGRGLDDPLRAVRREAVECRAKWYRYGSSS